MNDQLKLIHFACLHGAYSALVDANIEVTEAIEQQATESADRLCGMLASAIQSGRSIEQWLVEHGFPVEFTEEDQMIWKQYQIEYEAINGQESQTNSTTEAVDPE